MAVPAAKKTPIRKKKTHHGLSGERLTEAKNEFAQLANEHLGGAAVGLVGDRAWRCPKYACRPFAEAVARFPHLGYGLSAVRIAGLVSHCFTLLRATRDGVDVKAKVFITMDHGQDPLKGAAIEQARASIDRHLRRVFFPGPPPQVMPTQAMPTQATSKHEGNVIRPPRPIDAVSTSSGAPPIVPPFHLQSEEHAEALWHHSLISGDGH